MIVKNRIDKLVTRVKTSASLRELSQFYGRLNVLQ